MMPPLLVNENFPAPAVRLLAQSGLDVLAVAQVMPGAPDRAVLAHAVESGRWLVTFDRDYGELVFRRGLPCPPAIIYLRQEPVVAAAIADWMLALLANSLALTGHFVTATSQGTRLRALPG